MKTLKKIFLLFLILPEICYSQVWEAIDTSMCGWTDNLTVYQNKLVLGGEFSYCNDPYYYFRYASWDGLQIDELNGTKPGDLYCGAMEVIDSELYLGSSWQGNIYKWNGNNYIAVGTQNFDKAVSAIELYNGSIYASGDFGNIGSNLRKAIGRLHGTNWMDVGGGFSACVNWVHIYSLEVYKNVLYAGGLFCRAGGKFARSIARWNGTQWDSVGTGLGWTDYITDMEVDTINDLLDIAGLFQAAGGIAAKCIAKWDGHKWESTDYYFYDTVFSLKFYQHELYAGANSSNFLINDTCLSRFDGKNWFPILGPNSTILCMEVYQDKLYIGGGMTLIDTIPAKGLAAFSAPPPTHCNWLISRIYANTDTLTLGDTIHFENNNKYATSWAWNFGDGGTDSVQKPNYIYQNSGVYTASVIVHQEHCYDTAYFTVNVQQVDAVNNTKQKEYILGNNIPNPFTNSTIIPYQIAHDKQGIIIINDNNGKEIARYTLKESKGNLEVSTQAWQTGVYTYSLVVNGKKLESKRLEVVK